MSYCKHCGQKLSDVELATTHLCTKMGLLDSLTDGTFIVSTIIETSTGSSTLGSIGGNLLGGVADSVMSGIGSLFSSDDEDDDDYEEYDDDEDNY